jgi:MSHA biogenesis protein MshP
MSTICPNRAPRTRQDVHQGGFGVIAAIVILVILAGLSAFIVSLTTTQNLTLAMDAQGARAYQAARAGVEIGLARWLGSVPSNVANCNGTPVVIPIAGFTVTMTPTRITAGGKEFCTILGTASTGGAAGDLGFIERQISVVVEGNSL